jgi:hypothetical protein
MLDFCHECTVFGNIGVRGGLSKGAEDGRRPPALQAGNPWNDCKTVSSYLYGAELWFPEAEIREDSVGESHDQADAEWIKMRTQLRGHNDMAGVWPPFGRILYVLVIID